MCYSKIFSPDLLQQYNSNDETGVRQYFQGEQSSSQCKHLFLQVTSTCGYQHNHIRATLVTGPRKPQTSVVWSWCIYFVPGLIKHIVKSFGQKKRNVTSKLDKPCSITAVVKWDIRLFLLQRLFIVLINIVLFPTPLVLSIYCFYIYMFLRQESSLSSGITGSEFVLQPLKQGSCALNVFLRDSPHKDTNNKQHQLFSWKRIYYPPLCIALALLPVPHNTINWMKWQWITGRDGSVMNQSLV